MSPHEHVPVADDGATHAPPTGAGDGVSRSRGRAPVVYLDSSDFSNLACAATEPDRPHVARWSEIGARMRAAAAAGTVIFRFSHLHVIEATHVDAHAKPFAIARAQAIRDLCGPACFAYPNDLFLQECLAAGSGKPPPERPTAWRDDGLWFPDPGPLMLQWAEQVETSIREGLQTSGRPRPERRRFLRALRDRHGRLGPNLVSLTPPAARRQFTQAIAEEWMLGPRFVEEDLFFRCVAGEVPESEFEAAFVRALADVPAFVARYIDMAPERQALIGVLRNLNRDLFAALDTMRSKAAEAADTVGEEAARAMLRKLLGGPIGASFAPELRACIIDALWRTEGETIRRAGITERVWTDRVRGSAVGSLPGIDTLVSATNEHIHRNLGVGKGTRKLRMSDGADLVHLCYLPYVDVMRCDDYAGDVAKPLAARFGTMVTKISGLLEMLPSAGGA